LGDGKGGLTEPQTLFELDGAVTDVALGDINRDGHMDLVVVNLSAVTVSVFLGDGTGGFAHHGTIELERQPLHLPYRAALGDWNHDGHLDLAIAGEIYEASNRRTRFVTVLLGDGSGLFEKTAFFIALEPPEEDPPLWLNLIAVDYDGDGHLDLITSRREMVIALLGRGDGTFEKEELFSVIIDPPPGRITLKITLTDFNGDGCWDWVIPFYSVGWTAMEVSVSDCGKFLGRTFWWSSGDEVIEARVADLNNDGRPDVVYVTSYFDFAAGVRVTRVQWMLNNIPWEVGK